MDTVTLRSGLIDLLQKTDTQAPKYNRGHVFKSILEFSKEAIGPEESLSMMYCFHLYQRILTASQYGRLKLAKGFAQEAMDYDAEFSVEETAAGMESLKLPAVAYFNYVAGNYETALAGIRSSFEAIQKLYDMGLKEAILMKIEQVTNEFRVLYAMGLEEEAMILAQQLMGFVQTGLPSEVFPFALDEVMPDEGEKDQLMKYAADCILFKWVGLHPEDNSKTVRNLCALFAPFPDSAYFRIAEKVASLYENGISDWDSAWDLHSLFQETIPSMVKLLAIRFCFAILHEKGQLDASLLEVFGEYNKNYLRIPEQLSSQLLKCPSHIIS